MTALDQFTKVHDREWAGPDQLILFYDQPRSTWEIMRNSDTLPLGCEELGAGSPSLDRAAELALAHFTTAAIDRAHAEALDLDRQVS